MARAPAVQDVESVPEADRLDGVPHPRETRVLFGHDTVQALLAATVETGRMHHAWLITGAAGIGKATLAYRLASFLLAADDERRSEGGPLAVDPQSRASRQVRALSHPGLMIVRRPWDPRSKRFRATTTIDEVRRLRGFLTHTGEAGARRVVIVDSMDELNVNAANALLKSLEEPPAGVVFLLVTAAPGRLLPTIRSRCRRLDLELLGEADIRRAVQAALADSDRDPPVASDWAELTELAGGSARRALSLWLDGGLELNRKLKALLEAMPSPDWGQVHALADELASPASAGRMETFYELLLDAIARGVRAGAAGGGGAGPFETRLIQSGRLATWAELWETLGREKAEAVALNLDRKALILQTFGQIGAAARG